jgi:hypothetical protein
MLTGGAYVRSLFLVNGHRFVRVGRSGVPENGARPPAWLQPALTHGSEDAWVGRPIPDPENPLEQVVPVARHIGRGALANTWAGALIAFRRLEPVYQQTESASGVGLIANDGTALLLGMPEARVRDAVGRNISQSELFQRAVHGPDSGVLEGLGPFAGLRERMRQLGGALGLRTSPRGTTVRATLMITRSASAHKSMLHRGGER